MSAPARVPFTPDGLQRVAASVEALAEYVKQELAKRPVPVAPPTQEDPRG